jgi:hypothetical protein
VRSRLRCAAMVAQRRTTAARRPRRELAPAACMAPRPVETTNRHL